MNKRFFRRQDKKKARHADGPTAFFYFSLHPGQQQSTQRRYFSIGILMPFSLANVIASS